VIPASAQTYDIVLYITGSNGDTGHILVDYIRIESASGNPSTVTSTCPRGSAIVGARTLSGDSVRNLQPICAPVQAINNTALVNAKTYHRDNSTLFGCDTYEECTSGSASPASNASLGAIELYLDNCLRKRRERGTKEPQYVWTNVELEWEEHHYIEARYWASSGVVQVTVNGEKLIDQLFK
jgi:hypothetical protein